MSEDKGERVGQFIGFLVEGRSRERWDEGGRDSRTNAT